MSAGPLGENDDVIRGHGPHRGTEVSIGGPPRQRCWILAASFAVEASRTTTRRRTGLMAAAPEHLASFEKPQGVEIVDGLPIGDTRKVLERELRARRGEGHRRPIRIGGRSLGGNPVADDETNDR